MLKQTIALKVATQVAPTVADKVVNQIRTWVSPPKPVRCKYSALISSAKSTVSSDGKPRKRWRDRERNTVATPTTTAWATYKNRSTMWRRRCYRLTLLVSSRACHSRIDHLRITCSQPSRTPQMTACSLLRHSPWSRIYLETPWQTSQNYQLYRTIRGYTLHRLLESTLRAIHQDQPMPSLAWMLIKTCPSPWRTKLTQCSWSVTSQRWRRLRASLHWSSQVTVISLILSKPSAVPSLCLPIATKLTQTFRILQWWPISSLKTICKLRFNQVSSSIAKW